MQRLWTLILSALFVFCALAPRQTCFAQGAKQLAPGVLKSIQTNLDPRDSYSLPMPLPGLNATEYEPKYVSKKDTLFGQSRRVVMFRDVWQYEVSFLPLRQARLLVPDQKTGSSQPENVWYFIYRVRDTGKTLTYDQVQQSPEFDHIKYDLKQDREIASEEKFFLPHFSLEGWIVSKPEDGYQKVTFRDKISPMVLRQIQRREDPGLNLLDSVAMSKTKIPLAKSDAEGGVWGVAIFQNVDPRIDYVSLYISGLTNAYRIGRNPDEPTRAKTLQLNFWRPGDTIAEEFDNVEYGIPLVDNPQKQVLICQRYDLPGPLIRGYHINKIAANRNVLVVEANAQVNLKDFKSELTPELDKGSLPPSVSQAFADSGIPVNNKVAVKTLVPGQRWSFTEGEDEYILALEPQFWAPNNQGIRFIKSLDHLWIYR